MKPTTAAVGHSGSFRHQSLDSSGSPPPSAFCDRHRRGQRVLRRLGLAIALLAGVPLLDAAPPAPHGAVPTARQLAWMKETDVFGMLNFSTITFCNKEWGYGDEPAEKFNPTEFDALQIVRVAKSAGLKGLVIDAKHHGGFCLWPSKYNDHYSVKNAPWRQGKGDMIKELAAACRAEGLKVGIYLSPWDRNHKDYGSPAYLDYYENQLVELLTGYGPLFEIWLDGANGGTGYYGGAKENRHVDQKNYYPVKHWFELIRKHQPDALIFSDMGPDARWNGNEHGVSGEQSNGTCWATIDPPQWASANPRQLNRGERNGAAYIPAEADFPLLAKAWFWNPTTRTRTPAELVNLYFTSIGRNSAMDIGIAPDIRGLMSDRDAAALAGFGQRIRSIFGHNLADSATFTAENIREGADTYGPANVRNGWQTNRYWATDDSYLTSWLTMDFGKPTPFSVISLREHVLLGERIDDWVLEAWRDGAWQTFAQGSGIGMRRLWRGEPITVEKIRLRITKAAACPAIAEFAAFLEPEEIRRECGVKTPAVIRKGLATNDWKIVSATSEGAPANLAIDGNPGTFWHSNTAAGPQACPQEIVVDMARVCQLDGLLYLPRQDGCTVGNIATFAIHLSADGRDWGEPAAVGEFGNIKASPEQQFVKFARPVSGRYFKFTARSSADGIPVAAAEIGVTGN